MQRSGLSRRQFLQTTAAGTVAGSISARATLRAQGANERLGVGFIGFGIRGPFLLQALEKVGGVEVRACCDLYDGRLKGIQERGYSNIQLTKRYEEILENKDVDVVVIATPDHWHKRCVLDSLDAGKDVYIEKPMTYRWSDAAIMEAAVKRTGRVLQVGSQQASNPINDPAKEYIHSGKLGKITFISAAIFRNSPTGAWYYPIPPDASEQTIDWKRFIGDAPWHDFDPHRFFQWRLYWDYSGGLPTDLFVHMITLTHTLMNVSMPRRVTAMGGLFYWKEHREVPDHMSALVEYEEGFVLSLTSSAAIGHRVPFLTVMGSEGTLEISETGTSMRYFKEPIRDSYWYSTLGWPEELRLRYYEENDIDPQTHRPRNQPSGAQPETVSAAGDNLQRHMATFIEAVRNRQQPFEDVVFGGNAATVGHMVNLSYLGKRTVAWDPTTRQVV
ncbi:MAG: hypothetical protein Kow00109_25810 [Acidobacteriota bacterium]